MSTRTEELVSEWESVPFDGGYAGLRSLAGREFSGAVVAGPTRLFMLKGTVVGILDGDIEDFEDADGTARQSPHEALPLLAVMQDRADEPRAQYYTQETAIEEVDRTLADGNFTGFIELSENVLSGDYYLVYHQGRSMSVAWVGSSSRLITDDEAFEQANDEVGIYQVMPAEIETIEIPEPEGAAASPAGGQSDDDVVRDDGPTADPTPDSETDTSTGIDEVGTSTADESVSADEQPTSTEDGAAASGGPEALADDGVSATDDTTSSPAEASETSTSGRSGPAGGPPGSKAAGAGQGTVTRETGEEAATSQAKQTVADETTEQEAATDTGEQPPTPEQEPQSSEAVEQSTASEPTTREPTAATQSGADAEPSASTADLETRSIPSLDPERSVSSPRGADDSTLLQTNVSGTSSTAEPATSQPSTTDTTESQSTTPDTTETQSTTESQPAEQPDSAPSTDELAEVEAELADADAEIERLEEELSELSATNEELRSERDRLASELEKAEAEIERLESQSGTGTDAVAGGTRLSATEAIDGTNLFVRYHSKGEATLAKAQQGEADREQVAENLRLEYHTQFDAEDATVDGEAFETFLHDSIQYRFVDWLISSLLYEIRDTGNGNAMSVLYEALPEIDRAELNGKVSVTYTEDGQEHRSQEQFDVVVRDRMGNPLVVANINDSREAATEGQMTDIVRNAERVGNASDSLAAAFLVTSSFFEPGALETAEEATASGLFSRDKRKSFVNLSRKEGYHLCLLEARNNEFHLAVPEL